MKADYVLRELSRYPTGTFADIFARSQPTAHDPGVLASCGRPSIGVHMRIVDEAGRDVRAGEIGEIIKE